MALVYQRFALDDSLGRQRVLLARALRRLGVDVHFYGNVDEATADVPGVVLHDVQPHVAAQPHLREGFDYARFALAATRALRRDRAGYDIVDVSGTTAWEHDVLCVHAVTAVEQRRWPRRTGRTYRAARLRAAVSSARFPKLGVARAVERLQYRPGHYQLALAVTDEIRDHLVAVHGVPPDRIAVVPYPVDLDDFRSGDPTTLRNHVGLALDTPLALFVGHDFERKGLGDAIRMLAGSRESTHLAVVGEGDEQAYDALARELGTRDRVHFVGRTASPEAFFAGADVFVLPTQEDIWGISIVEAMAAGVPVVTTDAAGAAVAVEEASAGFVVPEGNVAALRDAVDLLARDDELRTQLGTRGRAAATRYGLDAFGRAMMVMYERAIDLRERVVGFTRGAASPPED